MSTLVDWLCDALKCPESDLANELANPISQAMADACCSVWAMHTNYMGCFDRDVTYLSLGEKEAAVQTIFNGHLNITVQQYIFCRWRKNLKYPHLPCVVEWHPQRELGEMEYFPLECINVLGVNNTIMEDKMFEP